MRVRAAVLEAMGSATPYAVSQPLRIADIELDGPGPGEVLLKMRAASLCHSDLSVLDGNRPRPLPMVLGHEASGVVEAVGPGVEDLRPGDHVVTAFVPSCGACEPCLTERPALCEPGFAANTEGTLLSGARRLHDGPRVINHHLGVSAFAEYSVASSKSLIKIDRELPFDIAALFGCAVMTGVGAVMNTAQMTEGASAAVVGLGGVGIATLIGARARSASQLVAVDLSDEKLAIARKLGATFTCNAADPDCIAKVREATKGGVNYAFEMAGSVKALEVAYRITRRGGSTVTAGLSPAAHTFALPHTHLVAEERTLKGSYLGSCVPSRDIPRYIEWYRQGKLPVTELLSEHIRLNDINAGFDRLATAQTLRQVIMFD